LVITNAREVEAIRTPMEAFGYTPERLQEARGLLDELETAVADFTREQGEAVAAIDERRQKQALANEAYMTHLKIARIALRGDAGANATLQLGGRRKTTQDGWLAQAKSFYQQLLGNDAWVAAMAKFGQQRERLETALAAIEAAEAAWIHQQKEEGEAQDATPRRNAALDDAEEWVSDYLEIAKIALAENPQQLEALGVVVR
jgi:hypothetical protein